MSHLTSTWYMWTLQFFNTLRPRQNGRHFPDNIFKYIFLYENIWITINISLKFVPKGSVDNIPALVPIMAWRRPGEKPLFEPTVVSLLTHLCVTQPHWVNRIENVTLVAIAGTDIVMPYLSQVILREREQP